MISSLLVGAGAALAACEEGPSVVSGYRNDAIGSMLVDAGKAGPIHTQVVGTPLGADPGGFEAFVLETMGKAYQQRVFRFTADATQAPRPDFRIVMLFDAPPTANANRLCRGEFPALEAQADAVSVVAVACTRERLWAEVRGSVRKLDGPEDPKLRALVTQVTLELVG